MHILIMLAIGLAFLGLVYLGARALGRDGSSRTVARGAGMFVLLWLVASAVDFYLGLETAGFTAGTEVAAHAVIFAVPAALALALAVRAAKQDPARPA